MPSVFVFFVLFSFFYDPPGLGRGRAFQRDNSGALPSVRRVVNMAGSLRASSPKQWGPSHIGGKKEKE